MATTELTMVCMESSGNFEVCIWELPHGWYSLTVDYFEDRIYRMKFDDYLDCEARYEHLVNILLANPIDLIEYCFR